MSPFVFNRKLFISSIIFVISDLSGFILVPVSYIVELVLLVVVVTYF